MFSLMPEKNTFNLLYNVDQGGQTNSTLLFTPDIKERLNQHCSTCGQINSTCCIQQRSGNVEVIYQTRERVFHQDIQTPRSGLKKRGAAKFF